MNSLCAIALYSCFFSRIREK